MKSVILNGSPRKGGATATVLKAMREELGRGGQVEWFDAYDLDIEPCAGCLGCRPNGDCVQPSDDAQRVRAAISSADALIVGTPAYWGNMSAPLKLIFDRNVTLFESFEKGLPSPKLKGKKAALVVASGAPWPFNHLPDSGGGAARSLRKILRAGGMKIEGGIFVSGIGPGLPLPLGLAAKARRISERLLG
ncbi:MAG: flavodoxin family protein [Treponema sp.]|nr:flavodoxin family protein [Treponema sp.]